MDNSGNNQAIFKPASPVKDIRLKISDDGRNIVGQNGKPFFYLADTAWTIFKRLNHDDVELYLDNRASKGFTVIQAYVLRGLEVPNPYGEFPLINRDPTRFNEGFFSNVDYIVNRANEKGLVMGLVTCFGEHLRKGERIFNRHGAYEDVINIDNAFEYGRILAGRYKDNGVIWILGGDVPPIYILETWDAMARGLKEGSNGKHLVSFHGPGGTSSSHWFHGCDWLDFNTIQSGHSWAVPNYVFIDHDRHMTPIKPTLDMEPRYENHVDRNNESRRMGADQTREAGYWAVFAGACGHGYGCNDIFQFSDETKTDSTADYSHTYLPPTANWRTAIDFGGAFGMGYLRKLMELRPWYEADPDQSVIAAGMGRGEDHIQALRAKDGSFILAYLTLGNPVSIDMTKLSSGRIRAQWYDPRSGVFTLIGRRTNTGTETFTAPTSGAANDWVLVLEDEDRQFPNELQ